MSLRGTNTYTGTSKPSPSSSAPETSAPTSSKSGRYYSLPAEDENSGSGSSALDGGSRFRSDLRRRRILFSRLLNKTLQERGQTTLWLSEQTGVSTYSISNYRKQKNTQLPVPVNAAKIADVLMEPRLRSLASIRRNCEHCGETFEIQTRAKGQRYCQTKCQSSARNRRSHERTTARLLAERNEARTTRDIFMSAVRDYCNNCTLQIKVCPDAECGLAHITHLPKENS